MRRKWFYAMAVLALGLLIGRAGFADGGAPAPAAGTSDAGETSVLKTTKDQRSYAVGVMMVKEYKKMGIDIDYKLLIRGITDEAEGTETLMSEDDVKNAIAVLRGEMASRQRGQRIVSSLDNKKKGDEFLASNKFKQGVTIMKSGLQYKIIKAGEGKTPTVDDTVVVRYKGTLIDGTEFENTYDAAEPATMKVSDTRIIAGVREALRLMPVGSRWQLFIPSRLAYASSGRPPYIGPNETLIFDIELLAIK